MSRPRKLKKRNNNYLNDYNVVFRFLNIIFTSSLLNKLRYIQNIQDV